MCVNNRIYQGIFFVAGAVPSAFPVEHPHSGEERHTSFPPAVSSEVLFAGRSCEQTVRPARLSAYRRKAVW